jgi:hypothetical protein
MRASSDPRAQETIAVAGPVLALRVDLEAFPEACHKLNRCRHTLSIILRQAGVFPTDKLKLHAVWARTGSLIAAKIDCAKIAQYYRAVTNVLC